MARRRVRVLAVGDAIVDILTPPIPWLPQEDAQLEVSELAALPGGNATNFALQMGALGAAVTLVACVGRDPFADVLRRAYLEGGVRARLKVDPTKPTGRTTAITWLGGRRSLITASGANASLRERDVPGELLESPDHVHRAGFWWAAGLQGRPTARLLTRAQRADVSTSLDISTDPQGWRPKRVAAVRTCLPHVDTFLGNPTEVCAVAGRRDVADAAFRLLDLGVGEVVLHLGERGSERIGDGKVVHAPAFRVPADNPTGCGDVFNAGYVFARLSGTSVLEALGFGNACAALHLADRQRPYPTLKELGPFFRTTR